MAGYDGSVLCLQFDSHKIISASSDCTIRVWEMEQCQCVNIIKHHSEVSSYTHVAEPTRCNTILVVGASCPF
jgi:WD40 repeat protein